MTRWRLRSPRFRLRLAESFLAQAAMILLPVAALTGLAGYSLRRDRNELEAAARAQAATAARTVGQAMALEVERVLGNPDFEIRARGGALVNDPAEAPLPPAWFTGLRESDLATWRQAEEAPPGVARRLWTQLAASPLPVEGRAEARFHALTQNPDSPLSRAAQEFSLASECLDCVTSSGAPLTELALIAAARDYGAKAPRAFFDAVETRVSRPNFLTAELVAAVAVCSAGESAGIVKSWEVRRQAYDAVRNMVRTGRASGWSGAGPDYLLAARPDGADTRWEAYPAARVTDAFSAAFVQRQGVLPPWARASVSVAGRELDASAAQGTLYAEYQSAEPPAPFALRMRLQKEALLYQQRSGFRLIMLAVVFASPLLALQGLAGLWMNHRRQQRLAAMKSNFVSSVSHELRAPIAAVRLMAESLDSGRVDGEGKQREYFGLISRECRRLSALVENVLDFARMEQGRRVFQFEPLDLPALLAEVAALMEPNASERGIKLALQPLPGDLPRPCWDRHGVEQMLVNLLDNAIKHSPEAGRVEFGAELPESGGPIVRLWVRDWGCGIPAAEQSRIFDLFYRYGSELRRETKGVGIGLHIVKQIAEAHGGRAVVESAPGQGSRFTLELPLSPPDRSAA